MLGLLGLNWVILMVIIIVLFGIGGRGGFKVLMFGLMFISIFVFWVCNGFV